MRQVARKGLLTAMATGSVLASTAGYAHAVADAHGAATNSPGVGSGNAVQVPVNIPVNACGNTINVIGLLNPAYGNDCSNVSTHSTGTGRSGSTGSGSSGSTGSGSTGSGSTGSGGTRSGGTDSGGTGTGSSGSGASGTTANSPGVLSGNQVQAPISAPVNACGNSANVAGVGNPAFGNECGNVQAPPPQQPPAPPVTPPGDDCPPPTDDCPPETGGEHGGTPGTPSTPGTDRNGGQNGEQPTPPSTPSTPPAVVQARAAMPAEAQLAHTGASALEVLAPAGALLLLGGGVLYRRSRSLARR
ncbi:chaplin [Kitasatospora sp. NPDC088134]|uniref:chaplin n=1 Tax=Kitasatospora sp. NPDC088134 TaxID=3364071 RepID=UPI0037FD9EB4